MPQEPQHIIQKSRLNLRLAEKEGAYQLQTQVLETFKTKVLPQLDAEMTRLGPVGQTIRLDRLELDLGALREKDLDQAFSEKLLRVFRAEIAKALHPEAARKSVTELAEGAGRLEALVHYLERGLLPWQVKTEDFSLEKTLTWAMAEAAEPLRELLQRIGSEAVRLRLAKQLTEAGFVALIQFLWPGMPAETATELRREGPASDFRRRVQVDISPGDWAVTIRKWALGWVLATPQLRTSLQAATGLDIFPTPHTPSHWLPWLRRVALLEVQGEQGQAVKQWSAEAIVEILKAVLPGWKTPETALLKALVAGDAGKDPASPLRLLRSLVNEVLASAGPVSPAAIFQWWTNDVAHAMGEIEAVSPDETASASGKAFLQHLQQHRSIVPQSQTKRPVPAQKPEQPAPRRTKKEGEAIYIANAGLVLLNPFFQTAFEGFGWVVEDQFVDAAAQENALWFVQLVGGGGAVESEAKLVLAKVLVGMSLDTAVRLAPELPEEVVAEAYELVRAAIGYWSKLGELDPAGFRQAFVAREGRLGGGSEGWQLKVERQTLDVLMEFMPWSIGVIRLPWMNGMLVVDW